MKENDGTDRSTLFPGQLAAPSAGGETQGERAPGPGRRIGGLRIFAWDPGNVSGTALYDNGTVVNGQVGDRTTEPRERRRAAFRLLIDVAPTCDALAYEHFIARQGISEAHADALYIQGAIEFVGCMLDIPVYRYTPRQSKSRVDDDKLKALGWFPPWGMRTGGHAADAARILVCTLIDEYPQELTNAQVSADS